MNGSGIAIAAAILFILVMFWSSLKANQRTPSESAGATAPRQRGAGAGPGLAPPSREPSASPSEPRSAPLRSQGLFETIDLRQFLCSLQTSYEPTLERRGIRLDLVVPSMPLTVTARKVDLHRLFAHIIRELCDMPAWGVTLRILARSDGAQAVINCLDAGVPEPRLARAFGGFAAERTSAVVACRAIVDDLGGRLYASPSPLGQQSLTLRFPLLRMEQSLVGSP